MTDRDMIRFYFDFSSPYAYIAQAKIDDFAAGFGLSVDWCAILLGPIFKETGNAPNMAIRLKGTYTRHDAERLARLEGLPLGWPETFPIGAVAAVRLFHWLKGEHPEQAVPFAKACFARYFGDGVDITPAEEAVSVAGRLGVSEDAAAAALKDDAVKRKARSENDAAMATGVFGSPFFLIGDEPFWGADRFWLMKRHLRSLSTQD